MQRFQNKTALKRKVETPLCDTWLVEHTRGPSVFHISSTQKGARARARAGFCPPRVLKKRSIKSQNYNHGTK